MKKLFLILFCVALVGCASNNVTSEGAFITTYDDVQDVTETIHKDLKVGALYNLRDNLAGEREHIMLTITNGRLMLGVLYQYNKWAFFKKAVFIADGERLEVALGRRQSDVISGDVVREGYSVTLTDDEAEKLGELLQNDSVFVAFVGDKYTTDKIQIKPKIRAALLATLEY